MIAQFQQKQCAFLPTIFTKSIFVTPASSGSSAWLFTTRPSACRGSSMWTLTFKRDSESTTCPKHRCDWTHNFHCSSDRHLTCHEQISLVNEMGEKRGVGGGSLRLLFNTLFFNWQYRHWLFPMLQMKIRAMIKYGICGS